MKVFYFDESTSRIPVLSVSNCVEFGVIYHRRKMLAVQECSSHYKCRAVADQVLYALFTMHKTW